MSKVLVLDCTLRDGGYCNQWKFGNKNIKKIVQGLINAKVDLIECGFLTEKIEYDENVTKYSSLKQLTDILPKGEAKDRFAVMVNYGEYDIDKLINYEESPVGGVRVAFHKGDVKNALRYCELVKQKGYRVFVQPMVSMNYTEEEFLELIEMANEINPYAFYIVDSFGTMKKKQLSRYVQLAKTYLRDSIVLGFHSHNNFQFAFSNALDIVEQNASQELLIDTSIYGMGRGAGNLNTELFLSELNIERNAEYKIKPLVSIMDEILNRFYEEKPWGYSFPNYLSALYGIHPNYATYLCEKNTLTIDAIDDIFSLMKKEKMVEFDVEYIEQLYEEYMSREKINEERMDELKDIVSGRKILLIAPGKMAEVQSKRIMDFIEQEKPIVVSINHEYHKAKTDYIFLSNMRRFREISPDIYGKVILTSNINCSDVYMRVDYYSLLNEFSSVRENAGLLAIQLMHRMGCDEIWLAGYDGYDYVADNNYESDDMVLMMSRKQIDEINIGMKKAIERFSQTQKMHFLTKSKLEKRHE